MKMKMKFENKIIMNSIIIAFIPLILSYLIFIKNDLSSIDKNIRLNLEQTGFIISNNEMVKNKLYDKENDGSIQNYTKKYIKKFTDIDIIVVADINGEKYSHLDESQIGQVYIGNDKKEVLDKGSSYFSLKEGSVGKTLRWFEPIMHNGRQVGFVMVGKYNNDIYVINKNIKMLYLLFFIVTLSISIIGAKIFGRHVKKEILNMEPLEIATLYNQKKIIINSVKDGIIALDKHDNVADVNNSFYILFGDFSINEVMSKLKRYIDNKVRFEMKEFIINGKKVFVTIQPIFQSSEYLGMVVTFTDKINISKVAKEITGVEEIIKNLRANIHEFRNNLHVLWGLMELDEYEEAKKYILNIQHIQENTSTKYSNIDDSYIKALLLSRELVAKERRVSLKISENSILHKEHNYIDSYDLVTITGNLIENALDACSLSNKIDKKVEVMFFENDDKIEIRVIDNGISINRDIRDIIFKEGISSKGKNRGIGLSLVKSRVELYNGEIKINEYDDEKEFVIIISKKG